MAYVSDLMDAEPDSPESDELELWAMLVEKYEGEHYPIDPPDPVDAIKFRMEQAGLKQVDLVPYVGSKSEVSEVLNRKRVLSLPMIRALHRGLGIPLESLMGEVKMDTKASGASCATQSKANSRKTVARRKSTRKATAKQATKHSRSTV